MELHQLDYFLAVAEEANFTRGARRMHAAQSAASAAIARLEREIRQPLFVRGTKPLRLTPAGQVLLSRARIIQAEQQATLAELAELRDGIAGSITIGTVLSFGAERLPTALRTFHRRHPRVVIRLQLSAGPIDHHLEKVEDGTFDVALVPAPPQLPPGIAVSTVERIQLGLACPADHPISRRREVSYRDIADETFVDFPATWGNRCLVDGLFTTERTARTVAIEVPSVAAALTLVAGGLGLSFVPVEFLRSRGDVSSVDLRHPPPPVPIVAAVRGEQRASSAAQALYRLLAGPVSAAVAF